MKRLFTVITFFMLFVPLAYAQSAKEMLAEIEGKWELDNSQNVTFSRIIDVPGIMKDELYTRALSYFTYNYVSGDNVIQSNDKDNGTIIGKGIYAKAHVGSSFVITTVVDTHHVMRIDIKDERARVIISLTTYGITIRGGDTPNIFQNAVSARYPIAQRDSQKTVMSKAFYKSYKQVMNSFDEIEKTLNEGSTGHETSSDW